jgi:hypothetical protein
MAAFCLAERRKPMWRILKLLIGVRIDPDG